MGMYGFSNGSAAASLVELGICFNPRWGCMVFQIRSRTATGRLSMIVSIPDGDVWFFKSPGRIVGAWERFVSIPDGDVWFFKSGSSVSQYEFCHCFNPRWGCMVFQILVFYLARPPSFWMFQSPMGMYGFSNFRVGVSPGLCPKEVSIPDGDVWFFKSCHGVAAAPCPLVSIPDGDVWFFKSGRASGATGAGWGFQSPMGMYGFSNGGCWIAEAGHRSCFNPRWGCMVFQMSAFQSSWMVVVPFQSPMGMYGFSNIYKRRDNETANKFQSPMGMYGFSNVCALRI